MKQITQHISLLLLMFILTGNSINAQSKTGYQLPHYEKFKLPNGLTVYLMEKRDVPVISVAVVIPAGAVNDGNKSGVASLTADCLRCGTKSYTKNEIEQQFDFVGASLNMNGAAEFAGLSAKFAVKDEEKILPIVKELLVNPVFPGEEFNKEKKRTLVKLDQAKESPGSVINSYWNKFFYGNHVYGNVVSGTVSSVTPLTPDDAKSFYKKYYNPEGSTIAVVGDFTSTQMKSTLTKLFGDWKKSGVSANSLASQPVTAPAATRVLLVNKDDSRETTLIIGSGGVSRNNPDYIPIQVVNTFFGGRFTSWINDELRIKSGLTYGAGSYFDSRKNNGTFIISTHTANETTKPTIDKALEVVNRLHNQTIDAETLTSAKNYMIGLFPPRYQTTDQLAGLLTSMFWYGYNESYINNFEANVNAVTIYKAKEIIAKYFPKDKLQFVLIGKSADIKKIAEKYGPVTEVQIKNDIGKRL
jgi:zinc protease